MTDPRRKAADLFRLACDGSSPHESETCLRRMVELVRKHGLAHEIGSAIEAGTPSAQSSDPWGLGALATGLACEQQRQLDIELARLGASNAMAAVGELPWEIRRGELGSAIFRVVQRAAEMPVESLKRGNPDSSKLDKAVRDLVDAIRTFPTEARANKVADAVRALFEAEPVQPGADAIARKLGLRAADVRAELKRLIEWGDIEAVGKGRCRRYRRVDERPE